MGLLEDVVRRVLEDADKRVLEDMEEDGSLTDAVLVMNPKHVGSMNDFLEVSGLKIPVMWNPRVKEDRCLMVVNKRFAGIITRQYKCEFPMEDKVRVILDKDAYMPEKAHSADAGYDLRTPKRVVVHRGSSAVIDTGVHMEIPKGYYGKLESKSGLNVKYSVVSHGGVIDSGYTGSIRAKIYNHGGNDYVFEKGDKVVQIIIQKCESPELVLTDHFEDSERGDNGFGSSGK